MITNIKNHTMKILFMVFVLFISYTTVQAQQSNFSGNWKLNRERTDFGELSENSTPIQMVVNQQKDTLIIERFSKDGQGEIHSYLEKLPFKGNTTETMIRTTKKISSIKWSAAILKTIIFALL